MKQLFFSLIIINILSGCVAKQDGPITGGGLTDADGNTYSSIIIGGQEWATKNLAVTHYKNGDPIELITDSVEWENTTTGAYCYYANNSGNISTYGLLYNWYAVNDPRGLAPNGWHIPSENEWASFIDFLGGMEFAGDKIRATGTDHWLGPNTTATNESGFTGLPAGTREGNPDINIGQYQSLGYRGHWWTTTPYSWGAWVYWVSDPYMSRSVADFHDGYSIRCIKD